MALLPLPLPLLRLDGITVAAIIVVVHQQKRRRRSRDDGAATFVVRRPSLGSGASGPSL